MFRKINIERWTKWLGSRTGKRLYSAVARFPMLAILAASITSIAAQQTLGSLWCKILFGLLVVFSALLVAIQRFQRAPWYPAQQAAWLCMVLIASGLGIGLRHEQQSQRIRRMLASFEESRKQVDEAQPEEGSNTPWKPIGVRATIEERPRYRRSTFPGSNSMEAPTVHSVLPNSTPSPEGIGWQTLTVVQVHATRVREHWQPCAYFMTLVIDGKTDAFLPGDSVELYCHQRAPNESANPGQFDQARWFAELGYAAQGKLDSPAQMRHMGEPQPWRLDRYLAMVSIASLRWIERYVVLDQAPLTAALVLGQREQVAWKLQEELLATSTIHMLSISGMHVELLALSLWLLGSFLRVPQTIQLVTVIVVAISYAMLCGTNPPVIRATIMLSGYCIATWRGWQFSSLNVLAFAGVVLLWYRTTVAFEIGTQLSFLAVAVLILSSQHTRVHVAPLEQLIEARSRVSTRMRKNFLSLMYEALRSSFWVWFITAPLVWSGFHVISPIGVLMNLLLWPSMFVALLSGLGLVVMGWLPPIGVLLGSICGVSLWISEKIIQFGEATPWSHFWWNAPPQWWVFGFYLLGLAMVIGQGTRSLRQRRALILSLSLWFALGLVLQPVTRRVETWIGYREPKLCVTFIDVGHGTSVLVESPDDQTWLYDAGHMGDHERSYQAITDALWGMNISRLTGVFVSHADSDHYNGVVGTMKRFRPGELITTEQVLAHTDVPVRQMLKEVRQRKLLLSAWKEADHRVYDSWSMRALHPPIQNMEGSDNANSLCLMVEFAGRRIFLPGDLEPPGVQKLTEQTPVPVDVMMAPHHGSLNAKAELLLGWSHPAVVVISGAHRATSNRVLKLFASEGREVYVTARDHAIRIEISADGSIASKHWTAKGWQSL